MRYDFNVLEPRAREFIDASRTRDAIRIYLFMADGDPSLDAGYLGNKLAECYERIGEWQAAKYWYRRAIEENPAVYGPECAKAREPLVDATIDDLVSPELYIAD